MQFQNRLLDQAQLTSEIIRNQIKKYLIIKSCKIGVIYMYEEQQRKYFAQQLDQVHQIYIKTSYGNIFSYAVGQHGQPLIIIVHGSGPRNSADQYVYLLHEYLVRISYIQKFFIIAIDCPGYGRSKGSKQAVKTFPLQMFRQILKDLGYNSYFAMLGHSQGGAAIFNAVYEDPKLTQFLLMDRPVCGNIKRFSKFPIPTLLIYDIQDDGHPVWQGKLLFKQLLSSQFYTYRNSKNAYWVPDNIWNLILLLFKKYSTQRKTLMSSNFSRGLLVHRAASTKHNQKSKSTEKSPQKKKHVSLSKCQQIKKQRQQSQKSLLSIKQIDKSEIYSKIGDLQQLQDLPVWLNQPKIEQTQQQVKAQKQLKKKQEQKLKRQIKIEQMKQQVQQKKISQKNQKTNNQKKEEKKQEKKEIKQQSEKKVPEKLKSQQGQDKCSICHEIYYFPTQTNCKHIFCKKCIGQSILVDSRCPLCRTQITKRALKQQLHLKILNNLPDIQRQKRQKQLNNFQQLLKSIVYVQIGNNSRELETKKSAFTKTKKKYVWQVYVKEPKNFKFEEVSFNINMGNPDSVPIRVTHAPFMFQSRSTFSFSCEITIKPKSKEYAPLISIYRIEVNPGNHHKIIALKKKKV